MKNITAEWLKSAESDLLVIERIIEDESLTHMTAFHTQQVVEKSFKAIIEEFSLGTFKSHSLENLYEKVKSKFSEDFNTDFFILLDQLYIDARYPGEMGLLPDGKPSLEEVKEFHDLGRTIFSSANTICNWVKPTA